MEHDRSLYHHVSEMPEHFKEQYILSGYRSPSSTWRQCLHSVVRPTNETANFWTHIIPAVYFIWWSYHIFHDHLDLMHDAFALPFLVYCVSMCVFPLASAWAHVFNAMSDHARHICFFLDYTALSFYVLGSAVAYKAYSFPLSLEDSIFRKVYLPFASLAAILSMTVCCATRFMPNGILKKLMRASSMALPYMFDVIPIVYRYYLGGPDDLKGGMHYHTRQFLFVALSGFFYLFHVPERLAPGRFDILFHSHQLFHVSSILATRDQMFGFVLDLQDRRHLLVEPGHRDLMPSHRATIGLMTLVGMINIIQLVVFSSQLHRIIPQGCRSAPNDDTPRDSGCTAKHEFTNGVDPENLPPAAFNRDRPSGKPSCSNQLNDLIVSNHDKDIDEETIVTMVTHDLHIDKQIHHDLDSDKQTISSQNTHPPCNCDCAEGTSLYRRTATSITRQI